MPLFPYGAGGNPSDFCFLSELVQSLGQFEISTARRFHRFRGRHQAQSRGGYPGCCLKPLPSMIGDRHKFWGDSLFLVTPRNFQRQIMRQALAQYDTAACDASLLVANGFLPAESSPAETVEKRQGAQKRSLLLWPVVTRGSDAERWVLLRHETFKCQPHPSFKCQPHPSET